MDELDLDDSELQKKQEEARLARLRSFAGTLVDKRKEAIDGRKQSGIETIWQEDDDHYDGIDEVNKSESMLKSSTPQGNPYWSENKDDQVGSTVFVNITQPYVDMASARVADMLLPTDDKPFSIKPTPVPEVQDAVDSQEEMPGTPHKVGDLSKEFIAEMAKKADNAETLIWDWLAEAGWHGEMRKVIEQSARIGTSVLKGPFPTKRKNRKMTTGEDGSITLVIDEEIKPDSKQIDVKNIYPDPACGSSIHNGSYVFEKDNISARQLKALVGTPGYIESEIMAVIKEGPGKKNIDDKGKTVESDQFEIWYFCGNAEDEDLRAAGCKCDDGESLPVTVVMVNDRIIKASLSVFDSGEFPYDVMVWQRRTDHWAGIGVSRQVRTAQRMVNAASRNLMDNAGLAAGPQLFIRQGVIQPADGVWNITPMKIWYVDEDADIQSVQHAITSVVIPTMQAELEQIIKMAMEFAEKCTSMPLLMQGEQGNSTQTVGGMSILDRNASTVLRRIAKICDDDVTEPHVGRYYEWLMLYSDDDSCKGDFNIVALGSTAFYQRDAANQAIMQLLEASANPSFNLDPDKLMMEVLKMNKISPDRVRLTDEQIQKKQASPPPPPPELQVAQMKIEGDMKKAQLTQSSDMAEITAKAKANSDEMSMKLQMAADERDHELKMKDMELQIKMMEFAQAREMSLDSIKAELAGTTMKLRTQKELSYADMDHKQAMAPPTEPVGRAQNGHSFQE